ncbi:DUF2516 family protein [Paenarthrobacter sp. NPDC058040]|uniref:DUF2516 family protein n=1 Tax=unclassified Paenarthrobacter TaxID=2634190 RepID=UPI002BA98F67|nr:DUF2516 family protein [Paenarthrobacter sp.]
MDTKFWIFAFTDAVYFILELLAVVLEIWALVDCLRHRPALFEAASKRTKTFWTALTAGALLAGIITLSGFGGSLFILGMAAVTAACVYLADVRPAVREAGSGGGRNVGPYGPW